MIMYLLKDRVTVDAVYIMCLCIYIHTHTCMCIYMSFIGVSQALSILTLLLDGLEQRRSEQWDL